MTIEFIKSSPVYQQVLKDSFGGIMYDVANQGKYDANHILTAWDALTPSERECAGGIMKGAMDFLKGEDNAV